ncbi:MAG TPA: hypothetical protein VGP82_10090, partial [Ktedonobacterales bacterium]|nr:hypothetical protein [Ktedonobacterales bacterium]
MENDDQQQDATPGAAEEPSGQPEQTADSSTPPAPGDVTIPPNIYPGYPPNPGTYPPQPGYPGTYPLPQAPTYPPPGYAPPQYPGYPPAPYPYGLPTAPGYGPPPVAVASMPPWVPPAPPRREPSGLGKPFPLAVTAGVGAAGVLAPVLAYLLRVLALQGDWSAGAQLAGIFALIALGVAIIGAIVRLIAGRNTAIFFVLSVLLLALLGSTSAGAFVMSNPLHQLQAQSYESQGQWEAAISEYKLSGEEGADTADIARVYDEWGEQFLGQQSYSDAVDRFLTVLTDYRSDTTAVARAHRDLYKTYVAWLKDS